MPVQGILLKNFAFFPVDNLMASAVLLHPHNPLSPMDFPLLNLLGHFTDNLPPKGGAHASGQWGPLRAGARKNILPFTFWAR